MNKLLPKSVKNPKGFTLVELLVVISIIAVLSIIGITIFSGVQKNARDARRKGDIESISKALESNYTSGSSNPYPILLDTMFASGKIPTDPGTYTYSFPAAAAATYCVCAQLENTTGGNFAAACATGATHYCRKNQQ